MSAFAVKASAVNVPTTHPLTVSVPVPLPATPDNVAAAQTFALARWREHVAEMTRKISRLRACEYVEPADLSNACRFAAVFAQAVFGGELYGNYYHVWCVTADGQRIDLTDGVQFADGVPAAWRARARAVGLDVPDPGQHDPRVWREREVP